MESVATSLREGKKIRAATDMVGSPTYTRDLAGALVYLITTGCYGTYHITNGGWASRYDIACEIADMIGAPRGLVEKVTRKGLNLAAPRPAFSGLNNFVWQLQKYKPLRPWKDAIKAFLQEKRYI